MLAIHPKVLEREHPIPGVPLIRCAQPPTTSYGRLGLTTTVTIQTQVEVCLFLSGTNAVALPLVWWHLRTLPLLFWKCPPQTNYPPTTYMWKNSGCPFGVPECHGRMIGYSQGARGLHVFFRRLRIFTKNSISPSCRWRQLSSRYTFHAGRQLSVEELRYLWTVRVTAAVELALCSGATFSYSHWAGVTLYTAWRVHSLDLCRVLGF